MLEMEGIWVLWRLCKVSHSPPREISWVSFLHVTKSGYTTQSPVIYPVSGNIPMEISLNHRQPIPYY